MKRMLLCLLVGCFVFAALIACKTDKTEGVTVEVSALRPAETIVINDACYGTFCALPEHIGTMIRSNFAYDGKMVLFVRNYATAKEEDPDAKLFGFYILNPSDDTADFVKTPFASVARSEEDNLSIEQATMYSGGIAVLDMNSGTKTHLLSAYDPEGNRLYSVDPEPMVTCRVNPYTGSDAGYEFAVSDLHYGENGTLYMVTEFSVIAVSPSGEKMYDTGEGIYINEVHRTADGRILVNYSEPLEGITGWAYMDDEAKGFSASVTLPDPGFEEYVLHFAEGWDVYYQAADGLYGMNTGDTSPTLLCSWESSGINMRDMVQMAVLTEDCYFFRETSRLAHRYAIMRRPPPEEIEPKTVITLGTTNGQNYNGYVGEFNRANTKYYIRIRDYDKQTAEGGNTLEQDILAGNAPDIVCSDSFRGNITNLASKGAFADLNTFLDADPAFRDNLLGSVRNACTTDGKLYQLASTIRLNGFVGASRNLPSVQEWTLDSYLAMSSECAKQGITFLNSTVRESMELLLLYYNLASFVDYDNAVCSFDSALFLSTIEYLKSLPTWENAPSTETGVLFKGLREGTVRMHYDTVGQFSDYLELCVRFDTDSITYLGIPTPNGGRPLLQLNHTYAITADSPVKNEAWAFVRYMLENGTDSVEFPVYKPLLEKEAAAQMRRYHLYSLTSTYYSNQSMEPEYDPQTMTLARLTEEHVAAVMDLLENRELYTTATAGSDATVKTLIAEELAAYYAGTVTAEEAARRIQSRVSIYLAEQS